MGQALDAPQHVYQGGAMIIRCEKHAEYPRFFWLPNLRTTSISCGIDWLWWGVACIKGSVAR